LSGIYIVNSSNVVITNVNSSDNGEDGVNIYNSTRITIMNSTFIGNNDSGVSTYDNITDLTIYNCSFTNNGDTYIGDTYSYSGIAIGIPYGKNARNVTIANNVIEHNGYANVSNKGMGILIYSDTYAFNFTIKDNFVNASWRDGIFVRGVSDVKIENNIVTYNGQVGRDPAGSGIKVVGNDSSNAYIENNNCSYNEGNGISVEGYNDRYLKNVTIYNNTLLHNGIDENDGNALFVGGRVVNVLIKSNVMKFSDAQAILIQEPYGWLQTAWIGSNITIEDNLIERNGLTVHSGEITAGITVGAYGDYNQDNGYIIIRNNTVVDNHICPNPTYQGEVGGIEIYGLNESFVNLVIENNTISNCSSYGICVVASKDVLIKRNVIKNCEVGVAIPPWDFAPYNITITQNSIYNNSYLGIDLSWDNVTINDGLLNSNQPNYGIDYPVITYAEFNGTHLYVEGFINDESAGTGSSNFANAIVEVYLVKNSTGGDNLIGNNISSGGSTLNKYYGEGWIYLGSITANSNGEFEGWLEVAGKGVEWSALITATATLNGNTSEFGPDCLVIKKINVSVGLTVTQQNDQLNVTIYVKAYEDMHNITIYWIKPENLTVTSITGDFNLNGSTNDTYWWSFYNLNSGEVKWIHIDATPNGEFRLSDVYNIGVDPEVVK
jgi:parallel beta-helix repeat protein